MCISSIGFTQALKSEVKYSARDSIRYDLKEQTVYLFGAATVNYEEVQLTADRISFSFKNEEATAFGVPDSTGKVTGKPEFVQDGKNIEADSIRYNFKTKQGLIREVRTQEDQAWIHANLSKRLANGEVHSTGGKITTCDRPYPHYHFKVGRMMVIPDKEIVAGPAYMKIGKVPTPLAIPFGMFPNKKGRSSGILIPIWGNSDQLGYYFLNGGYYLPISDRVDLQLTGDIYSRGSWALRGITRYKTRYRYSGDIDISRSTLLNSDPEFPDFSKQNNFFLKWSHIVDPKASLTDRFSASVNAGTSQNFTNNFNSSTFNYLSNTFQSNIGWNHSWIGKPYTFSANLRHSQNTLNRTFDLTLPALNFNVQRIFPFQKLRAPSAPSRFYDQIGVTWSSDFENRLSTTEEQLSLDNLGFLAGSMRNGIRHSASVTTTLKNKFFALNPQINFTDRMYFDQLEKTVITTADTSYTLTDTVPRFAAPFEYNMGATMTSKLYGMYTFRGRNLRAIRHVVTPSVGFSYRPDQSTQVEGPFGLNGATTSYSPYDIGVYGKPSAGASGALNFGLIQNIEAKVRDKKNSAADSAAFKKIKLIDFFSINSSYDMLQDSLRWSQVGLAGRTSLFNTININLVSNWDPYAVDSSGTRFNRSELRENGRLARMTYTNVAIGFDLKSKKYGQPVANSNSNDAQVVEESDPNKGARINFSLPWHLGVNYSYDVTRSYADGGHTDSQRQSVLFNGDVNILKYWKLGMSSGYDVVAKKLTPTSLNLYWDLHCWEFNFNIVPIGIRKSFNFRINVKASILRDLKYELRRPYGNSQRLLY